MVDQLKFKTVAIMSEDAAWTKPLDVGYEACLPKAGLKVVEHIRFSPDTTDFTPMSLASPSSAFSAEPMMIGVFSPGNLYSVRSSRTSSSTSSS